MSYCKTCQCKIERHEEKIEGGYCSVGCRDKAYKCKSCGSDDIFHISKEEFICLDCDNKTIKNEI